MNLQKKRSRAAVHEEPYIASHSKRQRLNQYSKAGSVNSPTRLFGHDHSPSSNHRYPNESDDITPMNRDPQVRYPGHSASVGFSGRVESAQIEPQQNQNSSFFPSSSDFKVVDSHFNSFRDHISTNNVIIHMNTGSSASNNKLEVPQFETKSSKQPMQSVHPVVRKSSEVYYRHLLTLGRGSPLWIPEPSSSLPVEYQKAGIGIGDVGILKDSGGFDFLFNVYLPPNDAKHPINPRTMPDRFAPLDAPEERDVNGHAEFKNHSFLASSHVDSRPYKSSGFVFESSAADGAILTMPNGASSIDLDNMALVRKYVSMNVKQWYTYANEVRGRDARNGDLRLVIGKTSATTWGMATFSKESDDQEISRLKFKPTRFGNIGNPLRPNYRWEYSGKAEVKSGPDEHEIEQLRKFDRLKGGEGQMAYENQCLFVRTINVTLQDGLRRANDIGELDFREVERDEFEMPSVPRKRRRRSWKQISQPIYQDNDEGKDEEDFVVPLQASTHYDSYPGFPPFEELGSYIDPAFWPTGTEPDFSGLGGQSRTLPPRSATIPIFRRPASNPTVHPFLHPEETGWSGRGGPKRASRAGSVSPGPQTFQSVDAKDDGPEAFKSRIKIPVPDREQSWTFEPVWSSAGQTGDQHYPSDLINNAVTSHESLNLRGSPSALTMPLVDASQSGEENRNFLIDYRQVSSARPPSPTRDPVVDPTDTENEAERGFREFDGHKMIPISETQGMDQNLKIHMRQEGLRSKTALNVRRRGRPPISPPSPSQLERGYPLEYLPPEKNLPVKMIFHSFSMGSGASASSPTKDPVSHPEKTGMRDHGGSSHASPFTQTVPSVDASQLSGVDGPQGLRFRTTPASNPPVSSSLPAAADGSPPSDSIESPVGFHGALNSAPPSTFTMPRVDASQPIEENESVHHSRWARVDHWRVSSSRPSSPTREAVVENDTDNAEMGFRQFDRDESIPVLAFPRLIMHMGVRAPLAQSLPRARRTRALRSFNERTPSLFNARSPSPSSPPSPSRAHNPPLYPAESDHGDGGPSGILPPVFPIIPVDVSLAEGFSFSPRVSALSSSPRKDPVLQPERTGLEDHQGANDQTGMGAGNESLQIYHPVVYPKKTELRDYGSSSSASPTAMAYHDDQMSQPHQLGIPGPSKSEAPLAAELHPSKIINEYLLNRVPDATMAITEDGDWISVLQTSDIEFPADEVLLSRIKNAYEVCVEEGVVFLEKRAPP